jgi:hypothetical protein
VKEQVECVNFAYTTPHGANKGKTQETKVNELTVEINTEILYCCEIQIVLYLRLLKSKIN